MGEIRIPGYSLSLFCDAGACENSVRVYNTSTRRAREQARNLGWMMAGTLPLAERSEGLPPAWVCPTCAKHTLDARETAEEPR